MGRAAERRAHGAQANTYRNNLAGYKDRYETLTQQTRQNFSKLNSQVATQSEQIKALEGEKDALQKKLAEAQAVPAATPASTAEIDTLKAQIQALNAEKARLQAAHVAEKKALEERLAAQPTTVTAEGDAGIVRQPLLCQLHAANMSSRRRCVQSETRCWQRKQRGLLRLRRQMTRRLRKWPSWRLHKCSPRYVPCPCLIVRV